MPHVSLNEGIQRARQMLNSGRASQAAFIYRQVVQQQPDNFDAQLHLGVALAQMGRLDEAEQTLTRALRLQPDHHGCYINLGHVYRQRERPEAAIRHFRKAAELAPLYGPTYHSLGSMYREVGQLDSAVTCFRQALAIDPGFYQAHSNLVYLLNYHPGYSPEAVFGEHREWARRHAAPLNPTNPRYPNERSPQRRLRIGYVSPDLRNHVIGLYIEPVLEHHDRQQFEVFCYSDTRQPDEVTARLRKNAAVWRETRGLSDEQFADAVRRDGIDLLVDLTLHMAGNRLLAFARRPAPVQITYLAYPGTSGMSAMGFKITDIHLDPPGSTEPLHSERLLRLPGSYWCYRPPENCPEVNSLPATSNGGRITFGALNAFPKVNSEVIRLWARVMEATPGSRLLVLIAGGEHGNENAREMFRREGIDTDRLELLARPSRLDFHRYFHRVDISLDPFPYNGHTTSLDSLWMGVPVVTLEGKTAVGRAGVSILTNIGLHDLIARSAEEYVTKALGLAHDVNALSRIRARLRQDMSTCSLTDAPSLARGIELLYREAWEGWCGDQTQAVDEPP